MVSRDQAESLSRRDWLLLLLALRNALEPLDPVRIQAGMFLLARNAELPQGQVYDFASAESGPFSGELETDLAELESRGLVAQQRVGGFTWSEFVATAHGLGEAQSLVDGMSQPEIVGLRYLAGVKADVLTLGFRDLMDRLLREYPDLASKSVFS